MGPPSDASGNTNAVACANSLETATIGQWVCEHRDPYIRGMVAFRGVVAGTPIANWWDNDVNAIAFSRGDRGFVAINREATTITIATPTGLAAGTYCDRLTGGKVGSACAGTSVTVATGGAVNLQLDANRAVAIDVETRL
jgi:alpha-amylase